MMPTNTTNMKTFAAADGLKLAYHVDDFTDPWPTPDTLLLLHAAMGSALRWFNWVPRRRTRDAISIATRGPPNSWWHRMRCLGLFVDGDCFSARQTADRFRRTMLEMPINMACRKIARCDRVGNVYGPVCVAAAERGKGFVGAMYEESRPRLPGRPALTLVRSDNAPSLQAHRRMGMTELGEFTNEGDSYIVFAFSG